jgi:hypothetical protein
MISTTLYLLETRAARDYTCPACERTIVRGSQHFRHDPHPMARRHRGERTSHWCYECITNSPRVTDQVGRIWIQPSTNVAGFTPSRGVKLDLLRSHVVGVGRALSERLASEPQAVHRLSAIEFEEFICDRLYAMGLEPRKVGHTFAKDGGVDVVFWPRSHGAFPFLGCAQLKHHRDASRKEGPGAVREFAGTIAGHPFGAALLVTNTSFTYDAQWFAESHAKLIRLRDFADISRWLVDDFSSSAEWREMPHSIELCPGVVVKLRE